MTFATLTRVGIGGIAVVLCLAAPALAQRPGGGPPAEPVTAREAAPVDLTGTSG